MYKVLFLSLILVGLGISCSNSKKIASNQSENNEEMEFTEERRMNNPIKLDEISIINSSKELIELYGKLNDPEVPRSAPIPPFDDQNETILVIKPRLKSETFKDIEIVRIQNNDSQLIINYKEIENWEFTENKWKDPIIILKVTGKFSDIQIKKIN